MKVVICPVVEILCNYNSHTVLDIFPTFHTIFASFYFALFQYFHDILLKYTSKLEVAVQLRDSPSHMMAISYISLSI